VSPYYLIGAGRGAYLPSISSVNEGLKPTGTITTQFILRIPCTLILNPQTSPLVLQYGHGLLGLFFCFFLFSLYIIYMKINERPKLIYQMEMV
jgi:hypothetical protein